MTVTTSAVVGGVAAVDVFPPTFPPTFSGHTGETVAAVKPFVLDVFPTFFPTTFGVAVGSASTTAGVG